MTVWSSGGKQLFEQLSEVAGRLEEITAQLSDPETVRDPSRLQSLMKERASLTPVAEAYSEYRSAQQTILDCEEMLEAEHDEEMRGMLKEELAQARENVLNAPLKYAKQFTSNADAYSDYGYSEPAFFELTRASLARNQEDPSLRYAIRARAKAVDGDFAAALQDSDKAVSMNSKEVLNYLNRADVYHMAGNLTAALADLDRAKQVKADNLYIYIIGGQIRDEQGDHKGALADYTELYRLQPRAFRRIPEEYLKDIPVAADDYKTYEKEKAAAKKKREEALKKEMKEQQDQKAQKAQKAQKQAVKK